LTFSGIWELLKTAIAYLWEEARLATALALDLIKTEVWDMVQAIPGLLLEAGDLLWSTGKVLFAFLGRGIMVAMEAASVALWEWLKGVPASLWDLGVKLKDTGRELFEEMGKGILAALISIPGLITQHVLVPLLSIESKINQIIALANSPALSAAMIVQQTFQPDNSGRNDTSTTGGVTFSAGTQSLLNARGAAGEGPLGLGGPVNINVTTQDPFLAAQIVVSELQMIGPR
jgi:hypothetical protein